MSQASLQTSLHSGVARKQHINHKVLQAAVLHAKHKDKLVLFPARSGRLSSRQIDLSFGRCLAVAMRARLPGTAALSCLLDQGVFDSQPMPTHFAAVASREHFTTKMITFCHSDVCAAQGASSSQVDSERVPVRMWCSYIFATSTKRLLVCTELIQDSRGAGPRLSQSSEPTHGATCRRVGVRRGLRALRRMERGRVLLFPAQSGRLSSRLIDVAFGLPSAVATLAGLAGTAALSFLLDQGVIGSQPMPAHFTAVTATKLFASTHIEVASRRCSAVAVLARLPGTAALSFLSD